MAISRRELEANRIARAVGTARADARAADLAPIIADAQAAGANSLRAIAAGLRTLRTITESPSGVVRRIDSGVGDSGVRRTGVVRSHDRRGRHSTSMGHGRLEA
jgi:hypothetical protein